MDFYCHGKIMFLCKIIFRTCSNGEMVSENGDGRCQRWRKMTSFYFYNGDDVLHHDDNAVHHAFDAFIMKMSR